MGALQIIGLILLPFGWMLLAAVNKQHRAETGVSMPSRSALKGIRRRAKKGGLSEAEYYDGWVERKQKREGVVVRHAPSPTPGRQPAFTPPPKPKMPERLRAPEHEPFDLDHLSMMAASHGWTIRKQAYAKYYIVDRSHTILPNPYARPDDISTDFTHEDLEDFLLTC